MKAVAETEMDRPLSLYEREKTKLVNVTRSIKVVDSAIFEVGYQAILKAQHMASTKHEAMNEAMKWSIILAKDQHDKEAAE